jgi:hypothetical protein
LWKGKGSSNLYLEREMLKEELKKIRERLGSSAIAFKALQGNVLEFMARNMIRPKTCTGSGQKSHTMQVPFAPCTLLMWVKHNWETTLNQGRVMLELWIKCGCICVCPLRELQH